MIEMATPLTISSSRSANSAVTAGRVIFAAALIRLLLLPVLMRRTGRAAWACPSWLRRVLPIIRFNH